MKLDFFLNFILLQFFYLSNLITIFLINFFKKTKLSYFATYFSWHSQTLKDVFQFIFYDITKYQNIIHFIKYSLTIKITFYLKKLFFHQTSKILKSKVRWRHKLCHLKSMGSSHDMGTGRPTKTPYKVVKNIFFCHNIKNII
jgi:hypothetical protein